MGTTSTTFGHKLKALRGARVVSQKELAHRMGVDQAQLSRIEGGVGHLPCTDTIMKIVTALALTQPEADELFVLAGRIPPDVVGTLLSKPALFDTVRKLR